MRSTIRSGCAVHVSKRVGRAIVYSNPTCRPNNESADIMNNQRCKLKAISLAAGLLLYMSLSKVHAQESISFVTGVDFDLAYIDSETPIYVEVFDSVTDGCWITSSSAEIEVKRELIDAGFSNISNNMQVSGVSIFIEALGWEITDYSCVADTSVTIYKDSASLRYPNGFGVHTWLSVFPRIIYYNSALLSGPKSDISRRINEQVKSHIDGFIVELHQEKRKLYEEVAKTEVEAIFKAPLLNAAAPLKQ